MIANALFTDAIDQTDLELFGLVVRLYKLAERRQWQEFALSDAYICKSFGVSRRRARRAIEILKSLGLLEITDAGGRSKGNPRRVKIAAPVRDTKRDTRRDTKRDSRKQAPEPNESDKRTASDTASDTASETHITDSITDSSTDSSTDILKIGLSTRSLNALRSAGLDNLEKIQTLTREELLNRPGVGNATVEKIVASLEATGRALRPSQQRQRREADKEHVKEIGRRWRAAYERHSGSAYKFDWHREKHMLLAISQVENSPDQIEQAFNVWLELPNRWPTTPTIKSFCYDIAARFNSAPRQQTNNTRASMMEHARQMAASAYNN